MKKFMAENGVAVSTESGKIKILGLCNLKKTDAENVIAWVKQNKDLFVNPFPESWVSQYDEQSLERLAIMTINGGLSDEEALVQIQANFGDYDNFIHCDAFGSCYPSLKQKVL